MTNSADEKRKQFMALYGSITGSTFDIPSDMPSTESDNVVLFDDDNESHLGDDIDMEAVRAKFMNMTNDLRMKRIIAHCGIITDPTFIVPADAPIPIG